MLGVQITIYVGNLWILDSKYAQPAFGDLKMKF